MACHYRVAVAAAQVGQPEVKLGLIPGAGGTQRLPRLAGVAKAAEMCAGGEPIGAADALAAGIVDKIIDGDLLPGAVAFARESSPRRTAAQDARPDREARHCREQRARSSRVVREQVKKKARGLLAPLKADRRGRSGRHAPVRRGLQARSANSSASASSPTSRRR